MVEIEFERKRAGAGVLKEHIGIRVTTWGSLFDFPRQWLSDKDTSAVEPSTAHNALSLRSISVTAPLEHVYAV